MAGISREEFHRAFINKRFWLVGLLAAISFAYGYGQIPLGRIRLGQDYQLGAISAWQGILPRGAYGFFATLMAGLPFADSLLRDRRHHYAGQVLLRTRYKSYLCAKILAVFCSGAAAVLAPALILLIVCLMTFPPDTQIVLDLSFSIGNILNPNVIEPGGSLAASPGAFVAVSLLMLALFGGVYALLGLGASFLIRNPYIVLGMPFLIYSFGEYILPTSRQLSWLGSTEGALLPFFGLLSPLLQYLAATALFALCVLLFGKKERILMD